MTVSAWAGSLNLVNDSPYTLRATIFGGDGTFLGEMVLKPEHSMRWTDTYGQVGHFGKGNVYEEHSTRSQTPYDVHWTCMKGGDFSISLQVATGGMATARSGQGRRICTPPPPSDKQEEQQ